MNAATENTTTTTETTKGGKTTKRVAVALATTAAAAGLAFAGAGMANASTVPVYPGDVTTTMTIENHTNMIEILDNSQPNGRWIYAPQPVLLPGHSEVVSATAPGAQSVFVNYRLGLGGAHAIYHLENVRGNVNTAMTTTTGIAHTFINTNVTAGYPYANATYTLV